MQEKRAATEILIQIEEKVNFIYTFMQNLDNTTKLILNKLNNIDKKIEGFNNGDSKMPSQIPVAAQFSPSVSAPIEDINPKKAKEQPQNKIIQKKQPYKKITDETKKIVSVSQKILYSDGSDATLVNVDIFDSEGNLLANTKTNTSGRWIKALNPGSYKASISKKGNGKGQEELNLNFRFDVPESDEPIELPSPLYGKK